MMRYVLKTGSLEKEQKYDQKITRRILQSSNDRKAEVDLSKFIRFDLINTVNDSYHTRHLDY